MAEVIEVSPKETLRRAGEVVVAGARKAGEVLVEYGPKVIEYMATEKFPRLVRNIVFMVMVGVMTYTMIRVFSPIASSAEYVAGQWASLVGTLLTFAVPVMVFFLVFALIKAILKWMAG